MRRLLLLSLASLSSSSRVAPRASVRLCAFSVGDEVKVLSEATFFHVPKNKDGFVAKGLTGVVERVYQPEKEKLSPVHPVVVSFSEPTKWKAHFEFEELALASSDESNVRIPTVLASKEVETCTLRDGSPCDQVGEFMTPIERAVVLSPEMPMRQAAELLNKNSITGAPVAIDGKLVGVLTQFDFLYLENKADASQLESGKWRDAVSKSLAGTVAGAMSRNPVAVSPSSDMSSVAGLMVRRRFNHVPVIDDAGIIVGILTSPDVLRHVLLRLSDAEKSVDKAKGEAPAAA